MRRREFLEAGVVAGAGLLCRGLPAAAEDKPAPTASPNTDTLNVALIGAGEQGRILINAATLIPGIRFRAVCDIWRYRRRAARYYLETYRHEVNEYDDYREMLQKQKDLHAVIIATPDFIHAEQANACMNAGLHVYCEKMMSNSLEEARSMVRTMRQTGRLLQIGYQRRSNPRYLHVFENLINNAKLAGRLTHAQTHWGHPVRDDLGWPKKQTIAEDVLRQYGYANMHEFRNWRFFKKYGAGPWADFGSQQIDICRWFLGATPRFVLAAGGLDYYRDRQWYDNVMAILEYPTPDGIVRAASQVVTTSSGGAAAFFEQFMGTEGTIRISENPKWTRLYHEAYAPDWDRWVKQNLLVKEQQPDTQKPDQPKPEDPNEIRVRETGQVVAYEVPIVLDKPSHQPHLENFFDAIRGKVKLTCPADEALFTEVIVHKLNEAITARKALELRPEDFAV